MSMTEAQEGMVLQKNSEKSAKRSRDLEKGRAEMEIVKTSIKKRLREGLQKVKEETSPTKALKGFQRSSENIESFGEQLERPDLTRVNFEQKRL